jgi:hypothetical protein
MSRIDMFGTNAVAQAAQCTIFTDPDTDLDTSMLNGTVTDT